MATDSLPFAARRIAVIGLAATGLSAARILSERGATVTVYDGKEEASLDAARVAEAKAIPGVRLALGVAEPDWDATDLVVPSPGVPKTAAPIAGALARNIPVWSEIEVAYRLAVAPILAITGTNGKTTTTALVGAICREAGLTTFVAGNIAEDEGKRTPLIEAAVQCPADGVIVAEISSFQLEHVHTFKPKVAAWLNLSVDHMDRYANMEEYAQAKAKIFAAQDETDYKVLNADDDVVVQYSRANGKGIGKHFTLKNIWQAYSEKSGYSHGNLAFVEGKSDHFSISLEGDAKPNASKYICIGGEPVVDVFELQIAGNHSIKNVMAALLIASAIGIDKDTSVRAVRAFRGVAHRMEFVREVGWVRYINNSMCTNPAAVEASVSAIDSPLVAIVGGVHKGGDLTPMYESLTRKAYCVIVIGAAREEIKEGLRRAGFQWNIPFADTLPDAVRIAASVAERGDTVMLVPGCASFDMFSGFEERGAVFRAAVKALGEPA